LLDELVPIFEEQSGYNVKVIAVGTGQALRMGEEGNADVMLVHAPSAELVLIENGSAVDRRLVMHNDFVIVGPPADPAGVRGIQAPENALKAIAESGASFVSRADDSGTHKMELSLWEKAGLSPDFDHYIESGQGMGATLRIASEKDAYSLTDRATFLSQQDTLGLDILVEGDAALLNVYHVMSVNPERWPAVNAEGALAWSEFLVSKETQERIAAFGVEAFGQPLFFPDAGKSESDLQ
jgi:tungstate transport system substrate-binding protein